MKDFLGKNINGRDFYLVNILDSFLVEFKNKFLEKSKWSKPSKIREKDVKPTELNYFLLYTTHVPLVYMCVILCSGNTSWKNYMA